MYCFSIFVLYDIPKLFQKLSFLLFIRLVGPSAFVIMLCFHRTNNLLPPGLLKRVCHNAVFSQDRQFSSAWFAQALSVFVIMLCFHKTNNLLPPGLLKLVSTSPVISYGFNNWLMYPCCEFSGVDTFELVDDCFEGYFWSCIYCEKSLSYVNI